MEETASRYEREAPRKLNKQRQIASMDGSMSRGLVSAKEVIAILRNAVQGLGLRQTCWNYVREISLFLVKGRTVHVNKLCGLNEDILMLNPSIEILTIRF